MSEIQILDYVIKRLYEAKRGAAVLPAIIAELETAKRAFETMPHCYADQLADGMFGGKGEKNA